MTILLREDFHNKWSLIIWETMKERAKHKPVRKILRSRDARKFRITAGNYYFQRPLREACPPYFAHVFYTRRLLVIQEDVIAGAVTRAVLFSLDVYMVRTLFRTIKVYH